MRLSENECYAGRKPRPRAIWNCCFLLTAILMICCFISACAPVNRNNADTFEQPLATEPQVDISSAVDESLNEQLQSQPSPSPATTDVIAIEEQDAEETDEGTPAEPQATIAQEIADLKDLPPSDEDLAPQQTEVPDPQTDFPLTMNRQVEYYLDFFQNRQHDSFARWLERSGRYLPIIREELKQAGIPDEIAYLPLIESGFNLNAYSRAHAVGPWQFIRSTGRHFGLTIDPYVDERRDIIAATKAAVQFLKELHEEFDSWYLAVAGYNAGAGTIRRAINKTGSDNFWKLAQSRYLPPETKLYVPKLIAAILIARDPEKYGFSDLSYEDPLDFESVEVPPWTPLQAVALACDADYSEIRTMNMELGKAITPPMEAYTLKVPAGKSQLVEQNLDRVRAVVRTTYKDHIVADNETINNICRQYKLNTITLLKANNLRKSKLKAGLHLRIPVQVTEYKLLSPEALADASHRSSGDGVILHRIRPGETLSTIARKYGVSMQQLASWNGIRDMRRIRAGSQLALYLENSPFKNNKEQRPVLASRTKEKPSEKESDKPSITYYDVRKGDSLWKIAQKFQLTTDQIREWNNLKSDMIQPGHRLILKLLAEDEEA